MSTCTACGSEVPSPGRFCSKCGSAVADGDDVATLDFAPATPRSAQRTPSSRPSSPSSSALNEGRFLPGRLIVGRYRIISLLGKGGMGEVYRADDLTLGQPVALKFLPEKYAGEGEFLERFRNEVRIARRVSHPNVCRVYDVGEVDGHSFFTMEYVDGEDLASLIRRIGRLPQDKALDIARQLCAGLAAAHAKGVLHRDLKPANIMLDGRGQVVVTDFGLAGVAEQIQGAEVRSGTPAYMAPEQLAGKEVTMRSDIYSLGLVLYEVFTGKRAFADVAANARSRDESTLSRPSSVVRDMDPVVERVILRCLETDAGSRPANVLSVAAALPGGDPLAAALAAGETPSPELVAASGETEGLRPRTAFLCLAGLLLGLAAVVYLTVRYSAFEKMSLEQPPEVLTQKAREILGKLGYEKRPADSAFGMYNNDDMSQYIEEHDKPRPNWDHILANGRPSILQYWYRQSPRLMVTTNFHDIMLTPGIVQSTDPPEIVSGMVWVELDPQGRLIYLHAVAPELESADAPAATPFDWNILFAFAGLDQAQLQPAQPLWNSLGGADTRLAWTGTWPGSGYPMRVEAASWRGKPVSFSVLGGWTKPYRSKPDDPQTIGDKIKQVVAILLPLCGLLAAMLLARRNYRLGRGDREGAARLALVMFALEIALWLCSSHLVAGLATLELFVIAVSTALFISGLVWVMYLALEPWVRRNWPQTIISWSRLLAGKWRDPVVGRDLLFGAILGVVWVLVFQLRLIPMIHMGAAPDTPSTAFLVGGRYALGAWLRQVPTAILGALEFFLFLLGLKMLLGRDWLAALAFVSLFTWFNANGAYMKVEIPAHIVVYAIAVLIVYRFGLVPLAVAIFTIDMLANVPFSADLSAWYMPASVMALLSVLVIAGWGFYHSLGGGPLWKPEEELGRRAS